MWHRIGKQGEKVWGKRGAGFAFTDGEHVLLLKRSDKCDNAGKWGLPGGKSEDEETLLGTAQRETREEIGHLPGGRRLSTIDQKNGRHHYRIYICSVPRRFDCELSDEHESYRWFPLDDLKEITLHDKLKEVIADIVRIIRDRSPRTVNESPNMSGFAEFFNAEEMAGATSDLWGGYHSGPDWQVEGAPNSMFPQRRHKRKKKR